MVEEGWPDCRPNDAQLLNVEVVDAWEITNAGGDRWDLACGGDGDAECECLEDIA